MARDPARQQQSEPLAELLDRLRVAKLGDIETGGKSEDVQDLVRSLRYAAVSWPCMRHRHSLSIITVYVYKQKESFVQNAVTTACGATELCRILPFIRM